jgi:uncharacterized membrane protein
MDTSTFDALQDLTAVLTLPIGILAAVFLGGQAAGLVFVVGWLLLVPTFSVLADWAERDADSTAATAGDATTTADEETADDPIATLRERYAAGEIDDVEFERRLEELVATEEVDVPSGADVGPEADDDRDGETAAEDRSNLAYELERERNRNRK